MSEMMVLVGGQPIQDFRRICRDSCRLQYMGFLLIDCQSINSGMSFQIDISIFIFGERFNIDFFFRGDGKCIATYMSQFMHGRVMI